MPDATIAAPPPPMLRDPWFWLALFAIVPLIAHSWGAPLGEPVAEDFDFLHHALFSPDRSLLDGGGSSAFWRPLAHQLYYRALAPLILGHPGLVAALHTALLVLATALLYRAFRRAWSGPAAAVIASFPLLSESTRTLISWPSHFVDLGVWLFTAIAIHEAAARRLATTLIALLAALLCKEVAVIAALLIPWMPSLGPTDRRQRIRWTIATSALVALWGALYLWVRRHAALALPHQLESVAGAPLSERFTWAFGNSIKALFSLPAVPVPRATAIIAAAVLLVVLAAVMVAMAPRARALVRAQAPWIVWGACWFLGATATLMVIHPIWAPNRSGYGSLGFAILLAAALGAAGPLLLGGLVALRLVAFALGPAPPARIAATPPETGAFMDFERLVRLQRLMRGTREILHAHHPHLPEGAGVGQVYMPWLSEYAFGGDRALQIWYRDTTLRWVRLAQFTKHPETEVATFVEFETPTKQQLALVEPTAMRHLVRATQFQLDRNWAGSMSELALADSIGPNPAAVEFRGTVAGGRAVSLLGLGQWEAGEREAKRGLELWPSNPDAHYALGYLLAREGRMGEARAEIQRVLALDPGHAGARSLMERIAPRQP